MSKFNRFITDEEFEEALQNKQYQKIVRYYGPKDKQEQMICLWTALSKYNPNKNCKFTTYLSKVSRFRRLTLLRQQKKTFLYKETDNPQSKNQLFDKLILFLALNERELIIDRYVYDFTLSELAEKHKLSISGVDKRLKKIQDRLLIICNYLCITL